MGQVTIEGSSRPCVELAYGEQVTVELTDHVQRLIDGGHVVVKHTHADKPKRARKPKPPKSAPVVADSSEVLSTTEREADYQAAQYRVEAGLSAQSGDDAKIANRPEGDEDGAGSR